MSSRDIVNEVFFKKNLKKRNENIQLQSNVHIIVNPSNLSQKNFIEIENNKSTEQKEINERIKQNQTNENSNTSFYNKYFKPIIFDLKHYFIPHFFLKNDSKIRILNELYDNINSKISIEVLYFHEENKNKEEVLNEVFSNKIINYI